MILREIAGVASAIVKFSLDAKVLDMIPENERIIFLMGGKVSKPYVFVHQKIVDFVEQQKFSGIRCIKVSDFEEGMQYRG